jgi:hypothetical protein
MLGLIERHQGEVILVHLSCRLDVLDERVQSESRSNKMRSLESSRAGLVRHDYFTVIPNRPSLRIDNSDLSPAIVAHQIIDHFSLPTV